MNAKIHRPAGEVPFARYGEYDRFDPVGAILPAVLLGAVAVIGYVIIRRVIR